MKDIIKRNLIFAALATSVINLAFIRQQTQPEFKFTDNSFIVGATITRRSFTYTDVCQSNLKSGTKILDSLSKMLINYPNLKIEIGVYASKPCKVCTTCSPTQNGAETLKSYLIKKGIAETRMLAKGYGLSQPLVKDSDKKAGVLNARTVIKIIYNKF